MAKTAAIKISFQFEYGNLIELNTPEAHGGYNYSGMITDQLSAVYLLRGNDQALASLQAYVASTVIPFCSRIVRFCAGKGGEYTDKYFHANCLETGI